MNKQDIIDYAVGLPEWERKQIVIAIIASMLTNQAQDEAIDMFIVKDETP